MGSPCARRSPLSRSGLTQAARRRPELASDYFQIDEREIADLILFGRRYAKYIQYYDGANLKDGDWSAFFENDVSASLAALAKLPVESFVQFHRDLETWLKADPARKEAALGPYFKLVFHLPLALLHQLDIAVGKLPLEHVMRQQVAELARRELVQPLRSLISWYKGAIDPAGPKLFNDEELTPTDYKVGAADDDQRLRLSTSMQSALLERKRPAEEPLSSILIGAVEPGEWSGIWTTVEADLAPFKDAGSKAYEQIYDALEYNLFESTVRDIYHAVARVKRDAELQLTDSLDRWSGHNPHYGLWLTFLRLFRHAQATLNGFTDRHLNFYLHDVLRLSARTAVPDRVHVLFELAKGVDAKRILAGSTFKAGKDALGRPVSYALDRELIANQARVAALSAIRIQPVDGGEIAFASTDVRSLDGLGKKPLTPDKLDWSAFGPASAPFARIGFAVADRKLFLREGTRTIRLQAKFVSMLALSPSSDAWLARLTGPDGWWDASSALSVTTYAWNESGTGRSGSTVEFTITLAGDAPSIVPFDPKIHGSSEESAGAPRLEVTFDFSKASAAGAFSAMREVQVTNVVLEVSATGVKQLSIVAGGAPADPSKPFAPFGAQPRDGASLIAGSAEIFSKPIASWSLSVDWQQPYNSALYFQGKDRSVFKAAQAVLKDGKWQSAGSHDLFSSSGTTVFSLMGSDLIDGDVAQTPDNMSLVPRSVSGFLRLTLAGDFGHADYPLANARALIELAKDKTDTLSEEMTPTYLASAYSVVGEVAEKYSKAIRYAEVNWTRRDTVPRPPYDPVVTRIEASYQSAAGTAEMFLHLHPFGRSLEKPTSGPLFPPSHFAGALLIGVAQFKPPARLSMLFQVADGSGSPLQMPPALRFEYLAGDTWVPFKTDEIDDKTASLAGSGVIGFAIPQSADTQHGILPDGLHWLRISAPDHTEAFNNLLSIDPQAALAKFVDSANDPQFLATPLPAETISKLAVQDPAIKKIKQPYSSFGGRPAESPEAFVMRVSERLRHKDRAVTAFDYEALVLDAFPQLYRAKCLPTSALVRDAEAQIIADNGVAPGAVTVVTVPSVYGRTVHNPLRPCADQELLLAVNRFLSTRTSPFVRLEVQNPKFEEVQAGFKVRFRSDIADIAFYTEALNDALVKYLTPWARAGGGEILFGGRLWKSSLIDFVEERAEVDYVTDFKLYHKPDADLDGRKWSPVDVELIETTTARSILVSAPHHLIEEIPRDA